MLQNSAASLLHLLAFEKVTALVIHLLGVLGK